MSKMTWEEIIIQIRTDPAHKDLVELAYFEEELPLNVERFRKSEEYIATLQLIKKMAGDKPLQIVDIGAGNGIAAVTFALDGHNATAVEPDPSQTIGAGAIRKLKAHYHLDNLDVVEAWGESLPLADSTFDVVYIRQAVHHAHDLRSFIKEAARLLKPGGVLFTARDHVIFDDADKAWFLKAHPLHRYYGGENAFTEAEYDGAIINAGLDIELKLHHYDSVINYFPEKQSIVEAKLAKRKSFIENAWKNRAPGFVRNNDFLKRLYSNRAERKLGPVVDATKIPGRLITYIARKPK